MKLLGIYRNTISEMEFMFRLWATPIEYGEGIFLFCHHQFPNSTPKRIAIPFSDKNGGGYDVFEFTMDVSYVNIPGQYPTSIGPALIKNIETIYPTIDAAFIRSKELHSQNNPTQNNG